MPKIIENCERCGGTHGSMGPCPGPTDAPLQREPGTAREIAVAEVREAFRRGESYEMAVRNAFSAMSMARFHILPPGEPAPKAEASESDLERARKYLWPHYQDIATGARAQKDPRCIRLAAEFAAVRREATSAGWDAALNEAATKCDELAEAESDPQSATEKLVQTSMTSAFEMAARVIRNLAANKPQDITPAPDPVTLLTAEAARLARSDDLEDQHLARSYQDAAGLIVGESENG